MTREMVWAAGIFALALGLAAVVAALGTSSSSWSSQDRSNQGAVSLYDQGVAAEKSGDYAKAQGLFEQALSTDKQNPDILNMLAHTQLKLGKIDEALQNYRLALQLRPRFPEAREYLGEAYLQAALRETETLRSYGAEGRESLEDLTRAFRADAAGLK